MLSSSLSTSCEAYAESDTVESVITFGITVKSRVPVRTLPQLFLGHHETMNHSLVRNI
ncbi:Protein of unknown function [Pyronema omphalodes CBS 100304]|uniref:Uncharacterized protein n=1 Tax=Pyronema omphalodes (strain CBS 100304) TaxID=1076935 RepID=U4KZD9_PYROM|nr:Protein of unknown function [Pyronema omphalodes CBS 100304]